MDHIPSSNHFLLSFFCLLFVAPVSHCQLSYYNYYTSCPNLIGIVRNGVLSSILNETRIAASLLRMHFHDCFVNGCDGSILLDDANNIVSEKNAPPNRNSVRGFEVIDNIYKGSSGACMPVTSFLCGYLSNCSSRSRLFGGPYWSLALGRRDGTTANETAASQQIPSPFDSLQNITAKFAAKGLDIKDVVVLSGAHTIGFAQCFTFKNRLYNFSSTSGTDPTLDPSLSMRLQSLCPDVASSNTNLAPLDPVTTSRFDNGYYKNLMNGLGLLQSDEALMRGPITSSIVNYYGMHPSLFSSDFGASMVKMANIGVLTGTSGQIRTNCRVVN